MYFDLHILCDFYNITQYFLDWSRYALFLIWVWRSNLSNIFRINVTFCIFFSCMLDPFSFVSLHVLVFWICPFVFPISFFSFAHNFFSLKRLQYSTFPIPIFLFLFYHYIYMFWRFCKVKEWKESKTIIFIKLKRHP